MQSLSWTKRAAGKWVLKSADGQLWAVVAPYRSEHACKNQFKATCMRGEMNASSVRKYGANHWTTGIGVRSAKLNIEQFLYRMGGLEENFQIAA